MADPKGIDFNKLESIHSQYRYRRDIVLGKLENPYFPDPAFPLNSMPVREQYRCSKYSHHETFENSILCPACGADLL